MLDFGIIPDSAGVQGLESALDNAVQNGADVLITSGVGGATLHGLPTHKTLRKLLSCVWIDHARL